MPELKSDLIDKTEIAAKPCTEELKKSESKVENDKVENETQKINAAEPDEEIEDSWMGFNTFNNKQTCTKSCMLVKEASKVCQDRVIGRTIIAAYPTSMGHGMVRDCNVYEDEYDECTSFRGRFQQYFVYGETLNCNQWKKDYDNCNKWTSKKDTKAVKSLIESEKARRMERLQGHYNNTVWNKRTCPPADWNQPLPEWLVKRDENSYLAVKAKELSSQADGDPGEKKSSCCIM